MVIQMTTPQARFAAAHAALGRGDLVRARDLLTPLIEQPALQLDALHVLAVVERRLGHFEAARAHFERLLRARPSDPHVHNNFANCLREAEAFDMAIEHYRRALDLRPDYLEAQLNLGLTLKAIGKLAEAHAVFARAVEQAPENAKAWQCLGGVQRELGEFDSAAASLDESIRLDPRNVQTRHARALLEAERGKPAVAHYAAASVLAPEQPDIAVGYALARYEAGESEAALALLERLTEKRPEWVKGHAALAQMRWQLGEGDAFARGFDAALARRPDDLELRVGQFGTLMRAGRYESVLARIPEARRAHGSAEELFDRYEAVCASEAGEVERADQAFARQQGSPDTGLQIAYVRHLLRTHRPEAAARRAEALVQGPAANDAWPYLSLAWRLLGDARSRWLDGTDGFVAYFDFPSLAPKLVRIAQVLRGIHHGRIHPFDQSLRGGTQTDGHLFRRHEPELVEVRRCIEEGVARYIDQLPPHDANHPFLRHRHAPFEFVGSYSVRLRAKGYHINHMHPDAWISCCLYIDMPPSIGADANDPAGWLTIGCPPRELGIELPPLTRVRPEPGRLAIFPSFMWHGTAPFPDGERMTIVSDLAAAPALMRSPNSVSSAAAAAR
jgi:tetratricopeptide (TPR) repeat protein